MLFYVKVIRSKKLPEIDLISVLYGFVCIFIAIYKTVLENRVSRDYNFYYKVLLHYEGNLYGL